MSVIMLQESRKWRGKGGGERGREREMISL